MLGSMAGFDVRFLVGHSLWIIALSGVVAALSYFCWQAAASGQSRINFLRGSLGWRRSLAGGLMGVATAFLVLPATHWLETVLWAMVWIGACSNLRPRQKE